jgi:hypothetical protein
MIMRDPSPYDDIPEDLVHRPEMLDAMAAELDQLARLLLPESIDVLRWATVSETASSSAQALEAEARGALRALLENPDDDVQLGASEAEERVDAEGAEEDLRWRRALEQALSQDIEQSLSDESPPWLVIRAHDLARTMAATWIGLGDSGTTRAAVVQCILIEEGGESRALIDDLCRRFELPRRVTRIYLDRVSRLIEAANPTGH